VAINAALPLEAAPAVSRLRLEAGSADPWYRGLPNFSTMGQCTAEL